MCYTRCSMVADTSGSSSYCDVHRLFRPMGTFGRKVCLLDEKSNFSGHFLRNLVISQVKYWKKGINFSKFPFQTAFGSTKTGSRPNEWWQFFAEISSQFKTWNYRSGVGNLWWISGVLCHCDKSIDWSGYMEIGWSQFNSLTASSYKSDHGYWLAFKDAIFVGQLLHRHVHAFVGFERPEKTNYVTERCLHV